MKKAFSKVVAAVCVVALMFATLFTGAVSATGPSVTCTAVGYTYSPGAVDTYVTYEVTFSSDTAFTAGQFTITSHSGLRFLDCTAVSTENSGVENYTPRVYINMSGVTNNGTNDRVLFAGFSESEENDIKTFTKLTLILRFMPDTEIKDASAGTTWPITLGNIAVTNAVEAVYSVPASVTPAAAKVAHVHNFTGSDTGSGVETKTCSICGAVDKTIVPGATIGSNDLANTKYASLSFTADGDTVLNALVNKNTVDSYYGDGSLFFVYSYKDNTAEIKTATSTCAGTLNRGGTDYYVFPCGRNGGIGRMSRNVTGNFIYVATNGGQTISAKWEYSIKSYLTELINGTDTNAQNYAKALWNYGYYTTKRLADDSDFFDDELAAYSPTTQSVTDWAASNLPESRIADTRGTDNTWTVSGVKVTTGFKPKMQFKLNNPGEVTVSAKSAAGDLVYKKTLTAAKDTYFTISDIPTKYLTGTVEVTMGSKTVIYSFGKYTKARVDAGASDANIFKWMMNYAYYLGAAFGA